VLEFWSLVVGVAAVPPPLQADNILASLVGRP